MTENRSCWFTELPAFQEVDFHTDNIHIISKAWEGRYIIDDHVRYTLGNGNKPNSTSQATINCAKKTLQILRDYPQAIPFWTDRANIEKVKQIIANKGQKPGEAERIVCSIDDFLEEEVNHAEKPFKLLESFAEKLSRTSAYSEFTASQRDRIWAAIFNDHELNELLLFLRKKDLIQINAQVGSVYQQVLKMTVDGWEYIRSRSTGSSTNKVFIATQFKWPKDDSVRERAMDAIVNACKNLGYEAEIVSQNHTGNITDKIVSQIKSAKFIVAELTYNNRGVYYEAGLARGLEIPVFNVIRTGFAKGEDYEGKKLHFDIEQIMYREWSDPSDLRVKLEDWINATLGKYIKA